MRAMILLVALVLGGCATSNPGAKASALQNAIRAGETAYASAAVVVAAYHALTPCGEPGAAKVCYDANSGAVADKALSSLRVAIDVARGVDAAGPEIDVVSVTTAVTIAALKLIPLLHQLGIL